MSRINRANLSRTIQYMKRNGLRETFLAALERVQGDAHSDYRFQGITASEREEQRSRSFPDGITFSVLVPVYRTPIPYLRAMIDSVLAQTYGNFELILADASEEEAIGELAGGYGERRIRYLHLQENRGISENTNAALAEATGEYIALLDHDDLLTENALYEMALAIEERKRLGKISSILYSDEDKCDEDGECYYEPNFKPGFNQELILSNNYICHLLVVETELAKRTGFRKEYDGAQDYDFALRAAAAAGNDTIVHIPRVLYHWRCHRASTAANPESKRYAYEAGGRAIEEYIRLAGWQAKVTPLAHLGFFRVEYVPDIWAGGKKVGLTGGKIIGRNSKITGGIYDETGRCPYMGLYKSFSGYLHRAVLKQNAPAVDIRLMRVNPKLHQSFKEITGFAFVPYPGQPERFDHRTLPPHTDYIAVSLAVCSAMRMRGYEIVWEPEWMERIVIPQLK